MKTMSKEFALSDAYEFGDMSPTYRPAHGYDFGEPAAPGSAGLCLKRSTKLSANLEEGDFGLYLPGRLNSSGHEAVLLSRINPAKGESEILGIEEFDSLEELKAEWMLD